MSKNVLDSIQLDNTGDGGSFNETYQSEIITSPDMPDNAETVAVAEGFDVRRGYRKEISFMILEPDAFAGTGSNDSVIDDLMEARADTTITFNWKNTTSTTVLSGAKVTALPVMDEVPDNVSVWYDTDTTATDNPGNEASNTADSSWTELEEVVGETGDEAENITRANGRGLPYWVRSMFMHPIPLFYDSTAYSNIKTEEDNRNEVRIAIENQAGNYRIYSGVHVRIHRMPSPDPDEVTHMILTCYQSDSFTNIITYPTGADDYFYGVEVTAEAFGHDEADILTENRTF